MKTRILPLATVVLGALAASFSACATSTEGVLPPGSEGGSSNGSGGAGAPKGGSAPTAGGAPFPTAGAPTGGSGAPSLQGHR